jgi:hypothetical protein
VEPLRHAAEWFALKGDGYQFWSGIGSGSPIIAFFIVAVRHRNCHVKGCWHLGHADPEHGFPACRKHHSQGDKLD